MRSLILNFEVFWLNENFFIDNINKIENFSMSINSLWVKIFLKCYYVWEKVINKYELKIKLLLKYELYYKSKK